LKVFVRIWTMAWTSVAGTSVATTFNHSEPVSLKPHVALSGFVTLGLMTVNHKVAHRRVPKYRQTIFESIGECGFAVSARCS
jgi:hypothetical protein